jgi:hypothetical protein
VKWAIRDAYDVWLLEPGCVMLTASKQYRWTTTDRGEAVTELRRLRKCKFTTNFRARAYRKGIHLVRIVPRKKDPS